MQKATPSFFIWLWNGRMGRIGPQRKTSVSLWTWEFIGMVGKNEQIHVTLYYQTLFFWKPQKWAAECWGCVQQMSVKGGKDLNEIHKPGPFRLTKVLFSFRLTPHCLCIVGKDCSCGCVLEFCFWFRRDAWESSVGPIQFRLGVIGSNLGGPLAVMSSGNRLPRDCRLGFKYTSRERMEVKA